MELCTRRECSSERLATLTNPLRCESLTQVRALYDLALADTSTLEIWPGTERLYSELRALAGARQGTHGLYAEQKQGWCVVKTDAKGARL